LCYVCGRVLLVRVLMQMLMGMDMFVFVQMGHIGLRMFVGMGMLVLITMQVLVLMCTFHTASIFAGGIVVL